MIEIAVLIGVIMGIAQIAKGLGLPKKYIPLLNLFLGIASGFMVIDTTVAEQIIYGAIIGLSASGLYDQSKITKK